MAFTPGEWGDTQATHHPSSGRAGLRCRSGPSGHPDIYRPDETALY